MHALHLRDLSRTLALLVLGLLLFAVTACASATPTPTATPAPTDTPLPPPTATLTATVTPSETPAPTNTPAATDTPAATATLSPTPTRTRTPGPTTLLFLESFAPPCSLDSGQDTKGQWGCNNGEFAITLSQDKYFVARGFPNVNEQDFIIEVDTRFDAAAANMSIGVYFRNTKAGYTVFAISKDGYYSVWHYTSSTGKSTEYAYNDAPSSAIHPDRNHLKVMAQGNQIAVYVNNQWLATTTDPNTSYGNLGMYAFSKSANSTATFDNFQLTRINRPLTLPAPGPVTQATQPAAQPTSQYALPPGKGGLVVQNFIGNDLTFTIANHQYTVPANGEQFIVLDPGDYTWSAFVPGKGQAHGTAHIDAGKLTGQSFTAG